MKIKLLSIITLCTFLSLLITSGCSNDMPPSHWDGEWERRVNVPRGMPGLCYDEKLTIEGRKWLLIATIHSTFECDKPYLELGFAADIDEVLIKKDSQENNVTLKLIDIHLISMIDITTNKPEKLSDKSVAIQSEKYVPTKWQQSDQHLLFNAKRNRMSASLFIPTASVAIPNLIKKNPYIAFKR